MKSLSPIRVPLARDKGNNHAKHHKGQKKRLRQSERGPWGWGRGRGWGWSWAWERAVKVWILVTLLSFLLHRLRINERIKSKEWQQICLYLIVYSKSILVARLLFVNLLWCSTENESRAPPIFHYACILSLSNCPFKNTNLRVGCSL